MSFFIRRIFCKHRQTAYVLKSRRYTTTPGTNFDYWQDYIFGTVCRDCGEALLAEPILLTRYPYAGEPHYPLLEENLEGKKNELKEER